MCKKLKSKTSGTRIDKCIRPLIYFLQRIGYNTVASCCGHDRYPMTVVAKIEHYGKTEYVELLSNTRIRRVKRFYFRDKKGHYYIPEVSICKSN